MVKKTKFNYKTVVLISVLLIIIVVTVFQLLIRKEDKLVIKETSLFQYTGDSKLEYVGNVEFDKNKLYILMND